jgi:hypothetical protein
MASVSETLRAARTRVSGPGGARPAYQPERAQTRAVAERRRLEHKRPDRGRRSMGRDARPTGWR